MEHRFESHNAMVEREELQAWAHSPARMYGYIKSPARGARLTTWLGKEIGSVVECTLYRSNLGARMASVRVVTCTGAEYYGRYGWDTAQVVNLRRSYKKRYPRGGAVDTYDTVWPRMAKFYQIKE